MKKLALLLAIVMTMSVVCVPSLAEETAIKESASGFYYVEKTDTQAALSAATRDKFIQVDGLYFKDLNGNGTLDVYEDWRADADSRVKDLLSQMNLDEKAGTLIFACIAGKNGSTVTDFQAAVTGFQNDVGSANTINPEHPAITSREAVIKVGEATYMPTAFQIQDMHVTTFIAALTGAPKDQLDLFNTLQKMAEDTRLGIPATFSGDRSYNTWGGMIDMAHYAMGVAHDKELLYNLVSEYAKESVAIGYHQVFHGYGNEIGSWYGDDPNYIAEMAAAETRAYDDHNFQSHSKHFIARGGRNAYVKAKSPANLIDSWKIGWQAVVDAGTQWVMTNNNEGVTPGVQGYMDKDTYAILRDELGYNGVVCLDWPLGDKSLMKKTGILPDGTDISTLSLVERYALILNAGVDMFSCYATVPGTELDDTYAGNSNQARPAVIVQAVNQGLVSAEDLDVHVGRVLKTKFTIGSFDNPYRDWEAALELIGTDAYKAEQKVPLSNDEINLYRRPEIIEMENKLMVESTIVLKNNGLLPFAKGVKLYADSNNGDIRTADRTALAAYATIVETMAEADACVFHVTAYDDNYEYMVEDAQAAGKPFVTIIEATNSAGEPNAQQMLDAAAFIQQTYKNTPDHGASVGSFYRYTTPSITADMLFGEKEPSGLTLFEVGYEPEAKPLSWGELQDDIGVTPAVRLYMAMLAKKNPAISMPNNLGDVLYTDQYGIRYSNPAAIELSLLTVPQVAETVTTETNGRVRTSTVVSNAKQKAGVPFEINFVVNNQGGAGSVDVEVLDGENVIARRFVGVAEGQFRVITMELTLEAGEHVITVGNMSATITVE